MKALGLFLLVLAFSSIAIADASIICAQDMKLRKATLGNEENYLAGYCEGFSTNQNICFKGDEKEGVEILKSLNDEGILGDEYSMRRFRARKSALKYDIYDGPNGEVLQGIAIPRCNEAPVVETTIRTTPGEVSDDSRYTCPEVAEHAVIMARKASLPRDWQVSTKALKEESGEVTFAIALVSSRATESASGEQTEEEYEVRVKRNCDVVSTLKIKTN